MIPRSEYLRSIRRHYQRLWGSFDELKWSKGPVEQLPDGFRILKFAPSNRLPLFTFATSGMSEADDPERMECFLLSPSSDLSLCELLTVIAWYHRTNARLGWGHTVNFGRPWLPESLCDQGLFSLPYLDGPELENLDIDGKRTQFLWLIPITADERAFKIERGLEALEARMESSGFDYADPHRHSIADLHDASAG
ncbi:MAG TPA: suppressor of fused domain protein [Pyrinomonadaceae bacterium]|nr:suppressor of fused domain protein [Pyrinomonadaceae bacterium]